VNSERRCKDFYFYHLLALAFLKELSVRIKHLVLGYFVEGLSLRKEELVYLTGIQKTSYGILSASVHPGHFVSFCKDFVSFHSLETFCARRKKLGRRKFLVPWSKSSTELLIN
jgi:hypothetical protein